MMRKLFKSRRPAWCFIVLWLFVAAILSGCSREPLEIEMVLALNGKVFAVEGKKYYFSGCRHGNYGDEALRVNCYVYPVMEGK